MLVRRASWEADGVLSLDLVAPGRGQLPHWAPGAHLEIQLASGLIRHYSMCGDLDDDRSYRISVLREPNSRGGSLEIHTSQLVGSELTIRGMRNNFPLAEAPRYLFLAGGIGITPILPMLQHAERAEIPWELVYGGRTRRTMGFLDVIAARTGGTYTVITEDESGYPDLDAILGAVPDGTAVYCCGPSAMLEAVETKSAQYLPAGALHTERFAAAAVPETSQTAGDNDSIEVTLARTGVTVNVPPDRSVLSVVLEEVPTFLYSCEEGYCGTCETTVLEGEPDHRDIVLTPDEQAAGKMMICVSRACSKRLVLDL
jgi:ferredoxin-NADP reductase